MPGPRYTTPNFGPSTRSEAYRQMLREKYGIHGGGRRDLANRARKTKWKSKRAPFGGKPVDQRNENGSYAPARKGWRA